MTTLPIDTLLPLLAQCTHDTRAAISPKHNEQVTGISCSDTLLVVAYKATMGTCALRGMRVVTCERNNVYLPWTLATTMKVSSPAFTLAPNGMYAEGIR